MLVFVLLAKLIIYSLSHARLLARLLEMTVPRRLLRDMHACSPLWQASRLWIMQPRRCCRWRCPTRPPCSAAVMRCWLPAQTGRPRCAAGVWDRYRPGLHSVCKEEQAEGNGILYDRHVSTVPAQVANRCQRC